MSQKRQDGIEHNAAVFDRIGHKRAEITTLMHDYPAGHVIALHFHEADQLVYASRGVMTVRTQDGIWVVPTDRAVWIPARVPHTITMSGDVAMRTLYLRKWLAQTLPRNCCVVNVSALLRELILRACGVSKLTKKVAQQRHLIEIILDQLDAIQTVPLQLPNVSDARACRIMKILHDDPSDSRPLSELCRLGGASKRTVERLFQRDAGMTFGKWRQQLRLTRAMQLLAEGSKVTHAALEAGYNTPSAFISMFRKTLGTTPASYFRAAEKRPGR
jgi:AraC-like DNA-binding protein/quercetin dioxygenase-like cupin family protein